MVTVNDVPILNAIASIGASAFRDKFLEIEIISKMLVGSKMFQLSWNDVNSRSISISSDKDCTVIVAIYEQKNRRESLMNVLQVAGWEVKEELEILLNYENENDNGIGHYHRTKKILSTPLKAGIRLYFKVPENNMALTIFVVEGKISLFSV